MQIKVNQIIRPKATLAPSLVIRKKLLQLVIRLQMVIG